MTLSPKFHSNIISHIRANSHKPRRSIKTNTNTQDTNTQDTNTQDTNTQDTNTKNTKTENTKTKIKTRTRTKWQSLDQKWQKILLSSNFVVKDTIADGNCQFRAIQQAIQQSMSDVSHKKIRKMIADYILHMPDIHFQDIIQNYRIERDNNEFYGNWDPYKIKTKKQLGLQIKKCGFNFEGDYTTLTLLTRILNIDIIIFNENTFNITKIENNNNRFIILNYIRYNNTGHYRTIGIKNQQGKVETIFNKQHLHPHLIPLFDRHLFFCKHIENIYNSSTKEFTCKSIIHELQQLTDILSVSDKKIIYKLLGSIISKLTKKNYKRELPLKFKTKETNESVPVNSPLNSSLNGHVNSSLNGHVNGPVNGTVNGPVNGPLKRRRKSRPVF